MATNEIQNGIEAVLASNHKRRCVYISSSECFSYTFGRDRSRDPFVGSDCNTIEIVPRSLTIVGNGTSPTSTARRSERLIVECESPLSDEVEDPKDPELKKADRHRIPHHEHSHSRLKTEDVWPEIRYRG